MTEEEKKVALDQPFVPPTESPAGDEVKKEETKEEVTETETEKPRVPYSRFENVSRARREAEAEAEHWKERARELEQRQTQKAETGFAPAWWTKLYGDTDQSKEAWTVWQQGQQVEREQIRQEAEQRALEAIEKREEVARESFKENLSTIEEGIETLSSFVGRDLTEKEESDVLDIVDEYTPKDEEGNYLGALLPFDKAWEIYELKSKSSKAHSRQSRDSVANVVGTPSNGQPTPEQEARDKNFRPGVWGGWRSRFKEET